MPQYTKYVVKIKSLSKNITGYSLAIFFTGGTVGLLTEPCDGVLNPTNQ